MWIKRWWKKYVNFIFVLVCSLLIELFFMISLISFLPSFTPVLINEWVFDLSESARRRWCCSCGDLRRSSTSWSGYFRYVERGWRQRNVVFDSLLLLLLMMDLMRLLLEDLLGRQRVRWDWRWPRLLSLMLLEAIHLVVVHLNSWLLVVSNITLEGIELRSLVAMVNVKVLRRRLRLLLRGRCWLENVDSHRLLTNELCLRGISSSYIIICVDHLHSLLRLVNDLLSDGSGRLRNSCEFLSGRWHAWTSHVVACHSRTFLHLTSTISHSHSIGSSATIRLRYKPFIIKHFV